MFKWDEGEFGISNDVLRKKGKGITWSREGRGLVTNIQ